LQRVSPADIDDVRPADLSFDLFFGNPVGQNQENVRIALEASAEIFLHVLPIPFGIGTCGGDEEEFRMFLVRQPNNLSVNRRGSSCPYLPAPDCNNCLWHVLILSQEPPMINAEANGQNAGAMTHRPMAVNDC
jgi:hypothetical protein